MKNMTLIMDNMVYHKIMYWVRKASPSEVSGLGKIIFDEDKQPKVISAMLLPQKNAGSSTDIEAEDMAKAMFQLKDEPGFLNFWWHSHGNMKTFWSTTDDDTIKMLGENGWFIATVFNVNAELLTCYYQGEKENTPAVYLNAIPTIPTFFIPKDLKKSFDKEYDKNVKAKIPTHTQYWQGGHYNAGDNTYRPLYDQVLNDTIHSEKDFKPGKYELWGRDFRITSQELDDNKISCPSRVPNDKWKKYTKQGLLSTLKQYEHECKKKDAILLPGTTSESGSKTPLLTRLNLKPWQRTRLYNWGFTNREIDDLSPNEMSEWLSCEPEDTNSYPNLRNEQ